MNIVILAAGKGKRMHSDLPKVLHCLAERPLLAHVIDTARTLQPARLVVVTGHGSEQVRAAFAGQDDLRWALQDPPQGTGHAVAQALPQLDPQHPTLVLYGDVPLITAATLRRLIDGTPQGCVGLLTTALADPTGMGRIVRDASGRVERIVEHKDADAATLAIRETNTGILMAPTPALQRWLQALRNDNTQGEYYLTDIIAAAVADGIAIHTASPGTVWECDGVNNKTHLAALERHFQRREADRLTAEGVTLADPDRIDVRGTLTCGRDVQIDINCVFRGTVHLGDRVRIGANCILEDAVIGADSTVQPMSVIESAQTGPHCRIGPFARLRPGTRLGEANHIGNFVETKNVTTGTATKANHLTYLGDSTIGSRVNIGAGTITCNYDGVNKSRTVIGDDAFIGSDTQLIAPVTVGEGATLGAGTTLVRDAPAHTLTVSRAVQATVPQWRRPTRKTP